MIRSTSRNAMALVEVVGMLPVMMALMLALYVLAGRMEKMRGEEGTRRLDDARIRDVVRRIQEDVARASTAAIDDVAEGRQLTLSLPAGSVRYAANARSITRLEQSGDHTPMLYAWPLEATQIDFQIETLQDRPRLVWIHCTRRLAFDAGPDLERRISTAAMLDRGGVR